MHDVLLYDLVTGRESGFWVHALEWEVKKQWFQGEFRADLTFFSCQSSLMWASANVTPINMQTFHSKDAVGFRNVTYNQTISFCHPTTRIPNSSVHCTVCHKNAHGNISGTKRGIFKLEIFTNRRSTWTSATLNTSTCE